jgi:hypothetical protein
MKYTTVVAATFVVVAKAQIGLPNPNCTVVANLKPDPGPFYMFEPGKADCGAGWAVPFGPVPSGCAKLELLVGKFSMLPFLFYNVVHSTNCF